MSANETLGKIEDLSDAQDAKAALRLSYEAKRAEIMRQIQTELDALEQEFAPLFETVDEHIKDLEREVRESILRYGASVRGSRIQAVYVKGRISWDNKGLSGYAAAHPEVLTFRKEGPPGVQLRVLAEAKQRHDRPDEHSEEQAPF